MLRGRWTQSGRDGLRPSCWTALTNTRYVTPARSTPRGTSKNGSGVKNASRKERSLSIAFAEADRNGGALYALMG